jgi:hypothetical protein
MWMASAFVHSSFVNVYCTYSDCQRMLWESVQSDKVWTVNNNLKAPPTRPQVRELVSEATLNWRFKYWRSCSHLSFVLALRNQATVLRSRGEMECRATTTKVLGWKGKNGSRSLERKGESTRKGPENAGPLERISWRTSVWAGNKGARRARRRTYWLREVPTSSLCASLSWLLSYSEAGSLSLLL